MIRYDFVSNSSSSSYIVSLGKDIFIQMCKNLLKYPEFLQFLNRKYMDYVFKGDHPLYQNFINFLKNNEWEKYDIVYHETIAHSRIKNFQEILSKIGVKSTKKYYLYTNKNNIKIRDKKTNTEKLYEYDIKSISYVDHKKFIDTILEENAIKCITLQYFDDPVLDGDKGIMYKYLKTLSETDKIDFVENCLVDVCGVMEDDCGLDPEIIILLKYNSIENGGVIAND